LIRFISIRVQNYKSIEDATLIIEPGLYRVVGDSQGYSSNGSGKTTVTQAITLALFNRDFSGAKLDEVSNRITGRGFCISLVFEKEGKEYTVVNNRQRNQMYVTTQGTKVVSGVKDTVRFITTTLGMGYETFCLTHFITSKTVGHITENLSSPSLFNDILQIAQLKELDKKFLEISKELKAETAMAQKELSSSESIAATLALTNKYDVPRLRQELDIQQSEQADATMILIMAQQTHLPTIKAVAKSRDELLAQVQALKSTLDNGVCDTCGTLLAGKDNQQELKNSLQVLNDRLDVVAEEYEDKSKLWREISRTIEDKRDTASGVIQTIKQDLRVAEEISVATSRHSDTDIKDIEANIKSLQDLTRYVNYSREQIKEGNVVKELLENFFHIVAVKIVDYSALINMNGMDVTIMANKLGMGVTLQRGDEFVPVSTLSNGEKTRLSLLVLISMLAAMKEISNAETNYLVFDEASSSFDTSGIAELEALFSYMKGMGQACFVITHGAEMSKVSFDHEVLLTKNEGISTCRVTSI